LLLHGNLGHQLAGPAQQMRQDGECLPPKRDRLTAMPETFAGGIQPKRPEADGFLSRHY
jgi:hypothetical protein